MQGITRLFVTALALVFMTGDAVSQKGCPHGACQLDPWVPLKDGQNVLRGAVRIVGSGTQATVQFRDANGVILLSPFSVEAALRPPVVLESGDEKADGPKDIALLQTQVAALQRNEKKLLERINAQH